MLARGSNEPDVENRSSRPQVSVKRCSQRKTEGLTAGTALVLPIDLTARQVIKTGVEWVCRL
jgi:hypothetical protein